MFPFMKFASSYICFSVVVVTVISDYFLFLNMIGLIFVYIIQLFIMCFLFYISSVSHSWYIRFSSILYFMPCHVIIKTL